MPFLALDGVSKRFDGLVAVDAVSFRIDPGQVVGFLGPNGAGKSTTMRMFPQRDTATRAGVRLDRERDMDPRRQRRHGVAD